MDSLSDGFADREPWVTRFKIDGQWFGGDYDAEGDQRLHRFLERYPSPQRVLELGCLEGGHTFPIARAANHVTAIDSRPANLDRARWLAGVLGHENITFVEADLESSSITGLGRFDVVFNVGLLYHLPEPWRLLEQLAYVADEMFLWTHVASAGTTNAERGGFAGKIYTEFGIADRLSGMSPTSFWPTTDDLKLMLHDAGFRDCEILEEDSSHPHGPAVILTCRSSVSRATSSPDSFKPDRMGAAEFMSTASRGGYSD